MFRLDTLLEAVRQRVEATSIRAVAAELGMSPSGLHVLLSGSRPHPRTRQRLIDWYVEARANKHHGGDAEVSEADAEAAIALLVRYIEANGRSRLSAKRRTTVAERLFGAEVRVG